MKKKKISLLLLVLIISIISISCGEDKVEIEENQSQLELDQLARPEEEDQTATIVTSYGDIKIKLFPEAAPKAVENFISHAKEGYYDGLLFHRVMDEFMIQTGDPLGNGTGGESIWGEPFEDEFNLDLRNYRGALSMANSGPNTNGSQFFIVQKTEIDKDLQAQIDELGEEGGYPEQVIKNYKDLGGTPWLDFAHTVFGQVYEGMDVVDQIASQPVDNNDRPIEDVLIKSINID